MHANHALVHTCPCIQHSVTHTHASRTQSRICAPTRTTNFRFPCGTRMCVHLCTFAPLHLCTFAPLHLCTFALLPFCLFGFGVFFERFELFACLAILTIFLSLFFLAQVKTVNRDRWNIADPTSPPAQAPPLTTFSPPHWPSSTPQAYIYRRVKQDMHESRPRDQRTYACTYTPYLTRARTHTHTHSHSLKLTDSVTLSLARSLSSLTVSLMIMHRLWHAAAFLKCSWRPRRSTL
jgi:hypothetical protein